MMRYHSGPWAPDLQRFSGFHACLFIGAADLIIRTKADIRLKLQQGALIFALFILGTVRVACNSSDFEMMFIEQRNFPGGPAGWLRKHFAIPVVILEMGVLSSFDILTDSVLVCLSSEFSACSIVV